MNKNDEDVVHAGIVSKSQKIPEFWSILLFATDYFPSSNGTLFAGGGAGNVCKKA